MRKIIASLSINGIIYIFMSNSAYADSISLGEPDSIVREDSVTISGIVHFIINNLITVGIILALVYFLLGGLRMIVSGGDKNSVNAAKNHLIAVIVGMVIVLLSFVILNIVFNMVGLEGLPSSLSIPSLTSVI